MRISYVIDPTRAYGITVYWPGQKRYWNFAAGAWATSFTVPACILLVAADPSAPCGDVCSVQLPDNISITADVICQLVILGANGQPIQTDDVQILSAPVYESALMPAPVMESLPAPLPTPTPIPSPAPTPAPTPAKPA